MDAYEKSALAYDLIQHSRGRDYRGQAAALTDLIRARHPDARSLLDVACGTGVHLSHLQETFHVVGLDLSPSMIERARLVVPDVPIETGDMRSFDLARRFDAITCLFSSIGYLLSVDDLHAAVANMARHLNPAGVLIVEPWLHPGDWRVDHRVAEATNEDGVAVSRVSVNGLEGNISSFDLYWTVADSDGVDQFVESHRLGLYTVEEYRDAFTSAGLTVEHDPDGLIGRGLFIGQTD
ncbi:MAG: class I SAM-dependent methyltransferase [Acidimicrobiales bacterium]|nr:class I SAM-dependent methyltransferase [Acidimicrobiales bacterium]